MIQITRNQLKMHNCHHLRLHLLLFIPFAFSIKDISSRNSSFNQDNTLVLFNPQISTRISNSAFRESDLTNMILTISSTFSKFLNFVTSLNQRNLVTERIPKLIAEYNRRIQNTGNKSLEVYFTFRHSNTDGQNHGNTELLKIATNISDEANAIFNGTVKNLILWFGNGITANNLGGIITSYSEMLDNSTSNYRLGADLPVQLCFADFRNVKYFKALDFVVFFHHASREFHKIGAERTCSNFIKEFGRCKEKAEALPFKLEVIFATSWQDTDQNGLQNYSSLVYFWEKMSNWSGESNTKVVLVQAFDHVGIGSSRQGWWRIADEEKLTFEDKKTAAIKEAKAKIKVLEADTSQNGLTATIITATTSFLVALTLVGLLVALGYRKLMARINKPSSLTRKEIKDFFEGEQKKIKTNEVLQQPWNTSAYNLENELGNDEFEMDEEAILGTGSFGVVCMGKVRKGGEWVDVAVKIAKDNCLSSALKGLLSEIKVLSHLGKCENIVGLIGANTGGLKDGKVFLLMELCSRGSLERYLREEKPSVCTHLGSHYQEFGECEKLDTNLGKFCKQNRLYKWSLEIANGMEYITSKKVVHADLATRNILLTENFTAKITDFGMSRKVYNYQGYMKEGKEPLPWRSMSPESLKKLVFNEKTDVWAFGVTLWEIYSLGDVPYGGLCWDSHFVSRLTEGFRLEKPENCNDLLYNLILKCWDLEPSNRPHFRELVEELSI